MQYARGRVKVTRSGRNLFGGRGEQARGARHWKSAQHFPPDIECSRFPFLFVCILILNASAKRPQRGEIELSLEEIEGAG